MIKYNKLAKSSLLLIILLLGGCITTDLQAPLPETLRIVNNGEIIRATGIYQFEAEYTDRNGTVEVADATWSSGNPSVLEFQGINAIANSPGQVEITAHFGELTNTLMVDVLASQESLVISMFTDELSTGDTFDFGVNYLDVNGEIEDVDVTWTSDTPGVATIDQDGVVTGVTVGSATISAVAGLVSDERNLTIIDGSVMVDPEVRFIQFDNELIVGESFQYEATYFGSDGQPDASQVITWSSDNSSALAIDANGLSNAISEGSAQITASSNGLNATLLVEVLGVEIRTGTLQGAGGYDISGDFRLELDENEDLILTITDYVSDGPGPYFYLTNSVQNVSNGLNLGSASSGGDYVINVSEEARAIDLEVNSYTYDVLMVWCEPFGVRLGYGEFEN